MLNSLMRISLNGKSLTLNLQWHTGVRKKTVVQASEKQSKVPLTHTHTPTLSDDSDSSDGKVDTSDIESEEIIHEFKIIYVAIKRTFS